MEWELAREAGVAYWRVPAWEEQGRVRARFFTRVGGVSRPPYDGLNFGFSTGDEAGAVLENRRRAAEALGLPLERWSFCRQVHGDHILTVSSADAGRGALSPENLLGEADGLATRDPGVVLAVLAADCVPILLYAPDVPAVAAVHSGWRGTAIRAVEAAVRKLIGWGADPTRLYAAIGPSIGPCCYEVDERVREVFHQGWKVVPEGVFVPGHPGHYFLDLWRANRAVLRDAGVSEDRVAVLGVCTSCRPDLCYSHRRDKGVTGRMAAAVALVDDGGVEEDDRHEHG
ncbi:MAG: peptidoglycan editing factor PgeF [Kyrpidia tusciae]|nr:peptidoglycan editing factor PgeF [Kyrpidia tusciae]MBE3551343.1 peptidoglycan editing factor PgeF [Kyrpidia tusciae]